MVDSLHHLLHNGSWHPDRTQDVLNQSPRPSANQGAKLQRSVPRSFEMRLPRRFPPPPRVEDESVSLAREYHTGPVPPSSCDEEPKSRGEVEQQPILLPVHKYNPERRFVLVPKTSSASDDESVASSREPRTPTEKPSNDTNTCLKFTLPRLEQDGAVPAEEATSPAHDGNIKRRRSRIDLAPIDTTTESSQGPASGHARSRASAHIEQDPVDYFDRQGANRSQEETLLSPSIIKHSTKGRERAYYDYSGGGGTTTESRSANVDNRTGPNRRVPTRVDSATLSPGTPKHRRSNSAIEVPQMSRRLSEKRSSRDETTSTRSSKKSSSPPATARRNSSSTRDRSEKLGRRNSVYRRRAESPDRSDEHAVEDHAKERRMRERRMSGLSQDSKPRSLAPEGPRPSGSRSKAQTMPVQPPRLVQSNSYEIESPSKAKSATFPTNRDRRKYEERAPSSLSSGSESPRSRSALREEERPRGPRPATRPQPGGPTAAAAPLMTAAAGFATAAALADRRKPAVAAPVPPPPPARRDSQESSSSTPQWQPTPFDPVQNATAVDQPAQSQSYRRFSEDISQQGNTNNLPNCPRQIPRAGYLDWMTLPRCDNFNVCPTCYSNIFQDSDVFRSQLVPAPFRPTTKEIACDMGSSHWYRIAWFMTKKQNYPDLRLFKGIAQVAAKMRPCRGSLETTRVWHSIRNPKTDRPIAGFEVCPNCVKSVEILFPNLVSVFQSVNSQGEPSKGVCAMHFAPQRQRFLEYFDVLESISDRAMSAKLVPDIDKMAKQLEKLSRVRECVRDNPRSHVEWHSMQALEDFTVCPQCFEEVVEPLLGESHIARNFYQKPSRFHHAACQLYSPRMRKIFLKACKTEDMDLLTSKVRERQLIDDRIHDQIKDLRSKAGDDHDEIYANEITMLREEWEKWE